MLTHSRWYDLECQAPRLPLVWFGMSGSALWYGLECQAPRLSESPRVAIRQKDDRIESAESRVHGAATETSEASPPKVKGSEPPKK